jgi:hypothetical protein
MKRYIELTAGNTFAFNCTLYSNNTVANISDFEECIIGIYWGSTKKIIIRKNDYQIIDNKIVFSLDGNKTRPIFGECMIEAKLITPSGDEINGAMRGSFFVRNLQISRE